MKLTKEQENQLRELAFAEKSNKEIAKEMNMELTDVHAAISRLGITIPKVKEAKAKGIQVSCRSRDDIKAEIDKVIKAWEDALKKAGRCSDRMNQLNKELKAAK